MKATQCYLDPRPAYMRTTRVSSQCIKLARNALHQIRLFRSICSISFVIKGFLITCNDIYSYVQKPHRITNAAATYFQDRVGGLEMEAKLVPQDFNHATPNHDGQT